MEETKIIYHIDDEETPYLVKLSVAPDRVTLADFKNVLNRPNFKFFFKSMDVDFGVVKEEIVDDDANLPCFNGRVVSWLVSAEGSNVSDSASQSTDTIVQSDVGITVERPRVVTETRPISHHHSVPHGGHTNVEDTTCTETESIISSRRGRCSVHKSSSRHHKYDRFDKYNRFDGPRINGHSKHHSGHGYETSSMLSSDLETTSFLDSEDDASSRITTTTAEHSSVSRIHARHRRQRRRRHRMPPMSRTSSFSSITDSTMSLNIITVTLNMDTVNFLGISIVGQSNKGGDGGIYVGSIMKGGAVALDGRIEPGDMILQVNDINFENMSNDEAVRVLREVVQKPGPIKLVVAKCWDPNPKGYFTVPRTEPVRPIDPGAWVAHTAAVRGDYPGRPPSVSTLTSTSSSIASSIPELDRPFEELRLTVTTEMPTIVRAMARPDSGLEIRDRMWLKITIPNAFIGADVVDWLFSHVEGFQERRECRKYAGQMLKLGYIRHTVNKISFSEQCYYIFGDLCGSMSALKIHTEEGASEADQDTLAPLPPPTTPSPWGGSQMPYSGTYLPHSGGYTPMPFNYANEPANGGGGGGGGFGGFARDGSVHSGSGGSSNSSDRRPDACDGKSIGGQLGGGSPQSGGSDSEGGSQKSGGRRSSGGSEQSATTVASLHLPPPHHTLPPPLHPPPPLPPPMQQPPSSQPSLQPPPLPQRPLEQVAPDVSGSRQSFRMAMGNPYEFFVDVM